MPRSTDEWVGKTDDTRVPDHVADRVCRKYDDRCQGPCGLKLGGKLKAHMDHIIALINGGENKEGNLQPLCQFCHRLKTKLDVQAKSLTARIRKKHLGIKRPSALAEKWAWFKRIRAERTERETQ
jgi:5-methylcytosine-specific restriction endonuclease McrA